MCSVVPDALIKATVSSPSALDTMISLFARIGKSDVVAVAALSAVPIRTWQILDDPLFTSRTLLLPPLIVTVADAAAGDTTWLPPLEG